MDFSKLRDTPREIDYLAYLNDECKSDMNEWERNFTSSCITGLRTKYQWLTQKQRACLDKMVEKYKLKTEHKDYCVRGFADREMHEVMNDKGSGTGKDKAANQGDDEDLEDIAF